MFLKSSLLFSQFLLSFVFTNKALLLINLKSRTAMNVKILLFVVCVEAIMYLLLYYLHDFTFNALTRYSLTLLLYTPWKHQKT